MTARPLLIDLYCKAGGAAKGYHRAGFDVIGVDIKYQPRYPFDFLQEDAMFFLGQLAKGACEGAGTFVMSIEGVRRRIAAFHASPPCQFGTDLRHAPGNRQGEHHNLIPETRRLLDLIGLPYVIENVDSDKVRPFMPGATCLCGTMFGLGVEDGGRRHQLQRHRLFTANFELSLNTFDRLKSPVARSLGRLAALSCHHHGSVIGVYGGHARRRSAAAGGRGTRDAWELGHRGAASAAMGIDWMTLDELSEAIPPAYTEFLGRQLMKEALRR